MKSLKALVIISMMSCLIGCQSDHGNLSSDVILSGIDSTIRPQDDFYLFAHGNWLKNNEIPESQADWGSFILLEEEVKNRLRGICETAATNKSPSSNEQKIGNFWTSGMDTLAIEKEGISALKPYLEDIESIKTLEELTSVIIRLLAIGVPSPFGLYVDPDDKKSNRYSLYFYQGDLGLPSKEYYLTNDSSSHAIRNEYIHHMARMFVLAGRDSISAAKLSGEVMNLETKLAGIYPDIDYFLDPARYYNKYAVAELRDTFHGIDWNAIMKGLDIHTDSILIVQPDFTREVGNMMEKISIETWKGYFTWHLLHKFADYMNREISDENFRFYEGRLEGKKKPSPRWKSVIETEEQYIGEILGQEYVRLYFLEEKKQYYEAFVDELILAFHGRLDKLDWMTEQSKEASRRKLNLMGKKIGYPEKYLEYTGPEITADSYLNNAITCEKWLFQNNIQKLGKTVDRGEWYLYAHSVGEYYTPSFNEICVPAGFLVIPGQKDENIDEALRYGYFGALIGHEITHGFDYNCSEWDEYGNYREWWTEEDRQMFGRRVKVIVNQFNEYTVLDSLHVDGLGTRDENIADLGGLLIAMDAFKKTDYYKNNVTIGGYTPLQRFFLAYALPWRMKTRDEVLRQWVYGGYHAPFHYRTNGILSNVPEFYEAFNIQPDDPMWRPDSLRVRIW